MKKIAEGNNPHVVNMLGAVTIQEPLCIITEFVEYGNLLKYLRASRVQVGFCAYVILGPKCMLVRFSSEKES